MGKSKQRILSGIRRNNTDLKITRSQAIQMVVAEIYDNPASLHAKELITLFGLSADELGEAGMDYEHLCSLGMVIV